MEAAAHQRERKQNVTAVQEKTYYDWYHLMKAVLEPMVFLNWQAAYDDQMEVQACFNIQYNITVSHKMLMDQEPYVNPVTQAQIGQ
ncbi:hypothetical protein STEG23_021943 [Scotinomys teguina]